MSVFSTDPFKPLTEAERVFANERYLRTTGKVVIDGRVYVTFKEVLRLLGVQPEVGQRLCQTAGWRTEKWRVPGDRAIGVYALEDIRKTVQRLAVETP
jgi:hypothetical protein